MRLLHYTRDPLVSVRSREQEPHDEMRYYAKPRGLWVSVEGDDDWKTWCESEHFWEGDLLTYEIRLQDSARILYTNPFTLPRRFTFINTRFGRRGVNWKAVAGEYQGIVIAPYCWGARMEIDWYYPWDCASGCIWDASAIAGVVDRGTTTFTPKEYDYAD